MQHKKNKPKSILNTFWFIRRIFFFSVIHIKCTALQCFLTAHQVLIQVVPPKPFIRLVTVIWSLFWRQNNGRKYTLRICPKPYVFIDVNLFYNTSASNFPTIFIELPSPFDSVMFILPATLFSSIFVMCIVPSAAKNGLSPIELIFATPKTPSK